MAKTRRVRKQVRAVRKFVDAVRRDPQLARDLVNGLFGREGVPVPPADLGDHTPPAGLAEFAKTAHARRSIEFPRATVMSFVADLSRIPAWLGFHSAWRGDAPGVAYEGLEFGEKVLVMNMPAEIAWTVTEVTESSLGLRGQGPMGVVLALWVSADAVGDSTVLYADAGLAGKPIEGPMAASILRNLGEAMTQSLAALPDAIRAAGPGAVRAARKPVLHIASGKSLPASTPVIVGAGQVVVRKPVAPYRDPSSLAVDAVRKAAADSGVGESLLRSADAVFAVASASWQYRDLAALVGAAVGASPSETVQSSPFGGDGAQLLVNEAAAAIAAGQHDVVLLVGAEAGASMAAAQRDGATPEWPEQDTTVTPTRVVGTDKVANNDAELAVGLGAPIYVYSLLESAVRHRFGGTPAEHTAAIGQLWSRFSKVGATNENAWLPKEFTADEIVVASDDNRMVSTPYTKLLCANLQVDLATGLILTSVGAAQEAGVPQEKWVFVHAGASAHDEWFVSERAELASSPAIRTIGAAALDHVGLTIDRIEHIDLYSCFPSAVQIGAHELGLPVDDPGRPLTVTGGLTFGGGPGNNYGSHGVANLVPLLRENLGAYGLSTSLGWYVTKHALGIYSATPPDAAFTHLTPIVENPPARPVRADYDGPGVVEAYTVPYGRDAAPEAGIVSIVTDKGERVLVRTRQPEILDGLIRGDALGRRVNVVDRREIAFVGTDVAAVPPPPPAPVLVERRGQVMIITLNRPHVRNAVNHAMAIGLERAIDAFEADPKARVAVLTGAGGFFCSGMDLKAAARGEFPMTDKRGPLGITKRPPAKPLIAAVEGPALAGGCELALAADLIVAARDSQFGIPEPKRGLVAAAGGVLRLRERLPRNIAMELALTGDPMQASRLADLGLINRIAEPGTALDAAIDLAERIGVNAPLSLAASKRIIDECPDWTTDDAFDRQSDLASVAIFSDDATEGMAAFAEKRQPVWRGR